MYKLSRRIFIPSPVEKVFEFFSEANNLNQITPPWLHFKILTKVTNRMATGALIDYSIRLHGIPIKWKTQIIDWDPPHHFVDFQLSGPYTYWKHTHQFEKIDNGTVMQDTVEYTLPGGLLAPLFHFLFVKKNLERIFNYRERALAMIFAEKGGSRD